MVDDEHTDFVDVARSACLCDVGAPEHVAATVVSADGSTHLIFAKREGLGDESMLYQPDCPHVVHEQLGELPLEFVRRLTISQRTPRPEQSQ